MIFKSFGTVLSPVATGDEKCSNIHNNTIEYFLILWSLFNQLAFGYIAFYIEQLKVYQGSGIVIVEQFPDNFLVAGDLEYLRLGANMSVSAIVAYNSITIRQSLGAGDKAKRVSIKVVLVDLPDDVVVLINLNKFVAIAGADKSIAIAQPDGAVRVAADIEYTNNFSYSLTTPSRLWLARYVPSFVFRTIRSCLCGPFWLVVNFTVFSILPLLSISITLQGPEIPIRYTSFSSGWQEWISLRLFVLYCHTISLSRVISIAPRTWENKIFPLGNCHTS
jgi:hypothetical protein